MKTFVKISWARRRILALLPVLAGTLLTVCGISAQTSPNDALAQASQSRKTDALADSPINLKELEKHGKLTEIEHFKSIPHQALFDLGLSKTGQRKDNKFVEIFNRSCKKAGGTVVETGEKVITHGRITRNATALQKLAIHYRSDSDTAYEKVLSANLNSEYNFEGEEGSRCVMSKDGMEILTEITISAITIDCKCISQGLRACRKYDCITHYFAFIQNDEDIKKTHLLAEQVKNEMDAEKNSMRDALNAVSEEWQKESQKLRKSLKKDSAVYLISNYWHEYRKSDLPYQKNREEKRKEWYVYRGKVIDIKLPKVLVQMTIMVPNENHTEVRAACDQQWVGIDEIHAEAPKMLYCYANITEDGPDSHTQSMVTERYKGACMSAGGYNIPKSPCL